MFQLTPKYDCMFESTEAMFNLLAEYDNNFTNDQDQSIAPKKSKYSLNIRLTDTIIYKAGIPISWYYQDQTKIHHKSNYKDIRSKEIAEKCLKSSQLIQNKSNKNSAKDINTNNTSITNTNTTNTNSNSNSNSTNSNNNTNTNSIVGYFLSEESQLHRQLHRRKLQ